MLNKPITVAFRQPVPAALLVIGVSPTAGSSDFPTAKHISCLSSTFVTVVLNIYERCCCMLFLSKSATYFVPFSQERIVSGMMSRGAVSLNEVTVKLCGRYWLPSQGVPT